MNAAQPPPVVLVTRPAERAGALCAAIEARGWSVLRLPVLGLSGLSSAQLDGPLPAVQDFDLAVFVSPAAVSHGLRLLGRWPARVAVLAVGAATAATLASFGVQAATPVQGNTSEAMLASEPVRALGPGQRVLLVRGGGGREVLGEALRARGVQVCVLEVYRRERLRAARGDLQALDSVFGEVQRGRRLYALVTSGEAVEHLPVMLGAARCARLCAAARPLTYSARLAALLDAAGWAHPARVVGTEAGALITAIESDRAHP